MIVHSYEEAKPIVLAEIAKGNKIGYITWEGDPHEGHKFSIQEAKKSCDYLVCHNPDISRGPDSLEYKMLDYFNVPYPIGIPTKVRSAAGLLEAEKLSDLVINSDRPIPSPEKLDECISFTRDFYVSFRRQYEPEYLTHKAREIEETLHFINTVTFYYMNKYYFHVDVRIASWKEGLRRFIEKRFYRDRFNCEYILTPPLRDSDGVCYSTSNYISPRNIKILRAFLKGGAFITSKEETEASLENKLFGIDWKLIKFEKYEGELLSDYGEGKVYFHIRLIKDGKDYVDAFML